MCILGVKQLRRCISVNLMVTFTFNLESKNIMCVYSAYHFKAGAQFEQQSSVLVKVEGWEVEERHEEVRHDWVLLAALRQPLQQLGTFPKHVSLRKHSVF